MRCQALCGHRLLQGAAAWRKERKAKSGLLPVRSPSGAQKEIKKQASPSPDKLSEGKGRGGNGEDETGGVSLCGAPGLPPYPQPGLQREGEREGEVRKEDENPSRPGGPLSRCGPGLTPSRTRGSRGSRRAPLLRAGGLARRDVCGVSELADLREPQRAPASSRDDDQWVLTTPGEA